jgi:hypothetical protein
LHFYCTDDYHADGYRIAPDAWLGQMSLIGHRFKQVLIDDKVIWEVDVADAEGAQVNKNFTLDLTSHIKTGKPFRLAFRVIDKVASDERLPMDYCHIGETEKGAATDADPWKFMTHVYVGDVVIADATNKESVVGRRPSSLVVEERHNARLSGVPAASGGTRTGRERPFADGADHAQGHRGQGFTSGHLLLPGGEQTVHTPSAIGKGGVGAAHGVGGKSLARQGRKERPAAGE